MNQKLSAWVEDYLFYPNFFQKIISFFLMPVTLIYMLIVSLKKVGIREIDFKIPIISIGNLIVGGSGKTPLVIKLATNRKNVAVILRGYGRSSKGLYVVSHNGEILEDVNIAGDEATLLSNKLKEATIIVSEDRKKAIIKAKDLGCKVIFLDDGFSKYDIKKFNILLRPKKEPTNLFCLPSGGYREPKMLYATADLVLKEGVDFERIVRYKLKGEVVSALPLKLVLLTAISKPKRLLDFLPKNTILEAYADHHIFTKDEIDDIINKYKDYSIITTSKDLVKLKNFKLKNLYLMDLDLNIVHNMDLLEEYIKNY